MWQIFIMVSVTSFRWFILGVTFLGCVLWSAQGFAQTNVNLRSGNHEGYTRLVFDWPQSVDYTVSKSGGVLSVSFGKAASLDISSVNNESLENVGSVQITSAAGSALAVAVQIKPQSKFRDFKIGTRVVVDVYDAPGNIADTKIQPPPAEEKPEPVTVSSPPDVELQEPISQEEQLGLEGIEPHVITMTSTQGIRMAAFEREGFLWLVYDDPELKTDPVLSGPEKDTFPKLEKIKLQNATAYRMQKPLGYNIYGEGGGLLWRLVMTPNPRRSKPIKPEVKNDGLNLMAGGSLVWPMQGSQRILTVTDPLVGDVIQVIAVDNSRDFAGERRQYVELEVLPSYVGLAYVPKADDITASVISDGLMVTRPQGLAISPERDTAPVVLKDDLQKEIEFFDEAENPTRMSRIFDFTRWEMGGVNSLEKNRRIIMVGLGNKSGSGKVEDLITLAKLNVANDRGQEALGLLRVAEQELPGIEQNAEFIALRGAAATLAGKYDEAVDDLFHKSVQQYGEINYWKTFALAGLEDWRQADKVAPTELNVLKKYPKQIRQPIVLAMSEVALRAGKKDKAEELLMMLEPEFSEMSLPRQSAWKYLNGELERQSGRPEQALANWEVLVKGRDDYFRAKAGLSLTKLQLERKKITPAKAIDRLEGLRYAWRGDELETLVNMRLGEVYINNEDYLKGLSVLRNAVSLSPNSIISEEVTDYMTETFRSLFQDGKLKDVSPLDAVSIYDEFKELTPIGAEGDLFVQELAERLVDVDLLGRASALLEHQLNHRLQGASAVKVGIRLAAIRLLDNKAEGAMRALDVAEKAMPQAVANGNQDLSSQKREIRLLRARALSKMEQASDALALLKDIPDAPDVLRLRADIAWNANQWDEAAEAFQDLIIAEDISLTRPTTDYQTNLILNRAIALNLSGNRVAISNLRERYSDLMMQTEKAKLFDLVTRPRKIGMLGNDTSITSLISEVDLFGEFLETYRKTN